jgi:phenylacetate-CoA ligase
MVAALEHLYPIMPVWAQNLGISIYGLKWRAHRLGGRFGHYVKEFREREGWSPERFRQFQDDELRQVVNRAFREVPYYQSVWISKGITPEDLANLKVSDLPNVPLTPKSDLRADPEAFVSRVTARSQRLYHYFSSGTTGTPITAICTSDGHRRFIAAREARSFGWAGTSLTKPRSMIGGRMVVRDAHSTPPFHRYNWAERQIYFSAFHISTASAPEYVAVLNKYRPSVLTGYAYSHYFLAKMMLQTGLLLQYEPDALILSSEKLTQEMKSVIGQAFRARAYEEYGCVENCVLATECEHGSLHVSPDFGIVEIVDDQCRPVPAGVEGRILCTSLLNEAQPLVRYEIGDLGAWSEKPCLCGRNHLPVLKEVIGRMEDMVTSPDGRQMVRFHGIFIDLPHVVEGQIIQEALDRFTIKVVTVEGFNRAEDQTIRDRFQQRLGNVQVKVEQVPKIPRTDRGKFRAVVSILKASS